MDYPIHKTVRVLFNGGAVGPRDIQIMITPFEKEDEAIRTWIRRNGMGLLRSWRVLHGPT